MAQHWSAFVSISDKQARALDRMAHDHSMNDGMSLLMEVSGMSRSKVSKQDRLSMQSIVDEAFASYSNREAE